MAGVRNGHYTCHMKTFTTAHIKLEDHEFAALHQSAQNQDLSTAQLVRKILRTYLDANTITATTEDGPVRRGWPIRFPFV